MLNQEKKKKKNKHWCSYIGERDVNLLTWVKLSYYQLKQNIQPLNIYLKADP